MLEELTLISLRVRY